MITEIISDSLRKIGEKVNGGAASYRYSVILEGVLTTSWTSVCRFFFSFWCLVALFFQNYDEQVKHELIKHEAISAERPGDSSLRGITRF